MAIYRGPGGSGDAVNDAASEVLLALTAKDAAIAAQAAAEAAQVAAQTAETNAETAETNAETAETNAETAETNAETAATNAASSASAASTSATNAAASASTATTQATNAASSASAASTSASNASTSATNAASSASTATTQATNASNSASAAATSATNAANSATSAATSATNAANSATAAAASAASINPASIAITGGSINGTTIGATTASTGKFTTLEATGVATFSAGAVGTPAITTTGDTNTGIFFPAADTIAFAEGGTESMRIDSSGRVLIGTTATVNPSAITPQLCLEGLTNDSSTVCFARNSNDVGAPNLYFAKSRGTSLGSKTIVQNGDFLGIIGAVGADGSDFDSTAAEIRFAVDGTPGANDMPGRIEFRTTADGAVSATERMRIDSSGNVGVGTSSPTVRFQVSGSSIFSDTVQIFNNPTSSAQGILFRNTFNVGGSIFSTGAATTNDFILWVGGSGTQGGITGNGAGVNYSSASDYRLKENVAPMTGALAKVSQLKPCTYTWKFDGSEGQGFIAHELQEVFPDAVTGKKDDVETYTDEDGNEQTKIKPQGVDTSFLVATLTAAIQELKAELDATKAEVQALKGVA